jgi:hypothetical protein
LIDDLGDSARARHRRARQECSIGFRSRMKADSVTNRVEHILHLAWKDRDKKAEHALRNLLPEIRGYKR